MLNKYIIYILLGIVLTLFNISMRTYLLIPVDLGCVFLLGLINKILE